MAMVYEKSKMLTDAPLHYCPGCTHGRSEEHTSELQSH